MRISLRSVSLFTTNDAKELIFMLWAFASFTWIVLEFCSFTIKNTEIHYNLDGVQIFEDDSKHRK